MLNPFTSTGPSGEFEMTADRRFWEVPGKFVLEIQVRSGLYSKAVFLYDSWKNTLVLKVDKETKVLDLGDTKISE